MTFIEVIIGITLLALIGTVSFVKLDLSNYKINSFIKQMTTDIRYIRQINKIGNEKVYMLFIEENNCEGYILMEEGRQSKKVFLPKGIELACPTSKILFNNYNYNKKRQLYRYNNSTYERTYTNKRRYIQMRKRSGYVLLEIIISVFIMSIIITCLLSIMAVINRANKNIEDRIELSQQTE